MSVYHFCSRLPLRHAVGIVGILLFAALFLPYSHVQAAGFNPGCTGTVGDAAALQADITTAGGNSQPDTITLAAGCTYTLTASLTLHADDGNLLTINGNGATISGGDARHGNGTGRDPYFGALTGSPSYFPLSAYSPAVNAGNPAFVAPPNFDQRGSGFPRVSAGRTDMGAYELQCQPSPMTIAEGDTDGLVFAILCANSTPTNDVINLTAGTPYTVTRLYNSSDPNNGFPSIQSVSSSGTLIINGNGATLQRDSSAPQLRFFNVVSGGNLSLNALTLTGGDLSTAGVARFGGAIRNQGTLTINRSTLSNNSADTGGAIHNLNGGSLTITNSTFAGNSATSDGGGILNSAFTALTNSTFAGNSAGSEGGAIFTYELRTLNSSFSTFHGNSATTGGALYCGGATSCEVGNTIAAGNTASEGPDISGAITSHGYNLIGSSSGVSGFAATDRSDANAVPLNLGPLANNGGPTQTMALLPGSVAINAGNPAFVPPPDFDQRGAGYPRVSQGRVDIGAFEAPAAVLSIQLTLQGRPSPPPPGNTQWATTVHLELRSQSTSTVYLSSDFTSSASGAVLINNLSPGAYILWIKGTHTLARAQVITLVDGINVLSTEILLEGDADDSNSVVLTDFSLLASSFGRASGETGYDARADFNQDGVVSLIDFSLLASNYGLSGMP